MKFSARLVVLGVLAALVLAVSPAALGDRSTDQLVVPSSSSDCPGFVETLDGTVNGCTPRPTGVGYINTGYSAAANGSIVFMANDNTDPSAGDQGSIWLVKPDGSSVHLDDSTWTSIPRSPTTDRRSPSRASTRRRGAPTSIRSTRTARTHSSSCPAAGRTI